MVSVGARSNHLSYGGERRQSGRISLFVELAPLELPTGFGVSALAKHVAARHSQTFT